MNNIEAAQLLQGASRMTIWTLQRDEPELVVTHGGPAKDNGKFAGWITETPEQYCRPILNTPPVFDTGAAAEDHMRKVIEAARGLTDEQMESLFARA